MSDTTPHLPEEPLPEEDFVADTLLPGEAEYFTRLVDTVFEEEDFSDCFHFID